MYSEKKSHKVTISLNKPQPELKLRVDVPMYHDLGCLKAIKKMYFTVAITNNRYSLLYHYMLIKKVQRITKFKK